MSPNTPLITPIARRIELLAFAQVQLLDIAGPLQVLTSANERCAERGLPKPYDACLVASAPNIAATAGVQFAAMPLPSLTEPIDTLIVAGGQGVMQAAGNSDLIDWVRQRGATARRVASVCTGAFMLGAAGLLDERRAVTHWEYCSELASRFPRALVETDPIFIEDGPIWTSAGVTAGIDLAMALVEQDLGRTIALAVARNLVVFLKRPGGQAQFSATLSLQVSGDRFGDLHAWMEDHLADDLSLSRLADQVGMSERSFGRRYREQTGSTPGQSVERLRVEAARRLLIETSLPLKRIATRCGFGSEETMRRTFLRVQHVGPKDYRDRFK